MINLLPDDRKQDIRAARVNVVLLRYNFVTIAAVGLLAAFCVAFYFILSTSQSAAIARNEENASITASYSATKARADSYRADLLTAKSVLDRGVNYTGVVFEIAKLLPRGVILESINLTAADFGKQITFSAHAKSYDHAISLKESLQNSKIFSNVYFQTLTDSSVEEGQQQAMNNQYPISVKVSAQLNKVETK